jgi:hypothetical protein
MDKELLDLINKIIGWNNPSTYPALKNLFKYVATPFCHFDIIVGHKRLFRSRLHSDSDGDFFYSELDLTFRYDLINITSFGRCNEPLQSFFYASDNIDISLSETFNKEKLENLKDVSYITTGVWKFVQNVMVAPIFEPENVDLANPSLVDVTSKCKDFIDSFNLIAQKDLLIGFLKDAANEFSKPFSTDPNAYLFSAAYSNYMLESVDSIDQNKRMEGIVYPTCKGIPNIRHRGLNYAFKTSIIGFGKKIELVSALRGKLVKVGKTVTVVDVIECKQIDRNTGIITWPSADVR